jgi:cell surface protein SprA
MPDTTITVSHGKKSKRLLITARTADGKMFKLKYRKIDDNTLRIYNKVDSAMKVKIIVTPKEPLDNQGWYKATQSVARLLMMVRNVSFSYRNNYSMSLPGFMPTVGDAFGQKRSANALSPGLDFAFGLIDDSYIDKARNNNWLLICDTVATPATTNKTEDLQLRATLEPVKNFKIDLHASRTLTTAKSIQYMYEGTPTTQSGTFSITTIALKGMFDGIGNANNGYQSKTFEKFCNSLSGFRDRVEAQYANAVYPAGTSLAGGKFDAANGTVGRYSADVMIPAFLSTYTSMGGKSLGIFPALSRMLPNWTIRYSGLGRLPWFRDVFKSVTLSHSYVSVYAVGAYSSYSTFAEYMNGLGFVNDATTGNPVPSSMFNVSTVTLSSAFSPLLGFDFTFNNNMTLRVDYKTQRALTLSMTSVQINESVSKDWTLGWGWTLNNFDLFGGGNHRKVKVVRNGGTGRQRSEQPADPDDSHGS